MAIAHIGLGVSWTPLTSNTKGGFPCLALGYLLNNLWLLGDHY